MQRKILILALALFGGMGLSLQAAEKKAATPNPTPAATKIATAEPTPAKTPESAKATDVSATASTQVHHKSPVLASTLAFFPGMIVHGSGHMYAGSWIKGLGLFALEGAGAGVAAYQVSTGWNQIQDTFNKSNNGIPVDLSPAYSRIGIIVVGTAVFLFTWFDDMAGAPIAAGEYNKRADREAAEASRAELNLLPAPGGAQLVYTAKF